MSRKCPKEVVARLGEEGLNALFHRMKKQQYAFYAKYLANNPPRHLDIGSGDGLSPLMIRKRSELEVDMVDLYNDSLDEEVIARLKDDPLFNHKVYDAGSALPFPDDYFGSVSLFYVLHHCPTSEEALQLLVESKRVNDNDGHVIVLEEVAKSDEDNDHLAVLDLEISKILYPTLFAGDNSYKLPNHFREYDEFSELTDIFEAAGFDVIDSIKPAHMQDTFPRAIYILR